MNDKILNLNDISEKDTNSIENLRKLLEKTILEHGFKQERKQKQKKERLFPYFFSKKKQNRMENSNSTIFMNEKGGKNLFCNDKTKWQQSTNLGVFLFTGTAIDGKTGRLSEDRTFT